MTPRPPEFPPPLPSAGRWRSWLLGFLLLAATLLAYQPVWHAGFIWDDDIMVTGNRIVQADDGLRAIWFSTALPDYFPMTSTVLWVQWRLWGDQPLGYHLVNMALHALSAVLWWRVLRRLALPGAWLAAAIFAVHPVNVESVAWISELKNTLAMAFFTLTLWAYLKDVPGSRGQVSGENPGVNIQQPTSNNQHPMPEGGSHASRFTFHVSCWYWLALVFFTLALLSKTAVAPLPVVLLGLAWWRQGRVTWRDARRSAPFFVAAAALALVTIWFQQHRAIGEVLVRDDSFAARLAAAGWAAWFYLGKVLLPLNLCLVYPLWHVDPAHPLSYAPGLLAAGGLAVCWRHRSRWGRAWLLALGFFVVMLLPILGFLDISFMRFSLVADRWQYFAIMGPIALAAAGISRGLKIQYSKFKIQNSTLPCAALLATLATLTWHQCRSYSDLKTLWQATLARNPDCAMAHSNLGDLLLIEEQVDEAVASYRRALAIQPDAEIHNNLGTALLRKGRIAEAAAHYEAALSIKPDHLMAHNNLGNIFRQQGRWSEAIVHYRSVLEIRPDFTPARHNLGMILLEMGRADEAVAHFRKLVELQPDSANLHNNLGWILRRTGRYDEALPPLQRALEIQPGYPEAYGNLARTLALLGRAPEAVAHFQVALRGLPDDAEYLADLAWLLATWPEASVRNGNEALELASRANQLTGGRDPVVLRSLAASQAECGRFAEAEATARRALELAESKSNAALAGTLREQMKQYQAGAPVREGVRLEIRPAAPKPGEGGNPTRRAEAERRRELE